MMDYLPTLEPWWPVTIIAAVAAAIIVLTVWTYRNVEIGRGGRRWLWLLVLRLLALAVACLVLLRPSWELKEIQRIPATIILVFDGTKSMAVKDEDPNKTRWEAAVADWKTVAGLVPDLEKQHQVRIETYQFDTKLREFKPDEPPNGDRTAITEALSKAYDDRDRGTTLLGIVLLSDGRDNVGKPALEDVLAKLSRAPCPVHTIGLGHPGGSELQPDIIAQTIEAPQTARVKDRLTLRGTILAQRFIDQPIEVWLLIDGKPVPEADNPNRNVHVVVRPQSATQTIPIEFPPAKLPDQAGDIKVSLWAKPIPGELTETNNEVATYVTLIKEGLSVLYIDKLRAWEPKFLKRALKSDERITLYDSVPPSQDVGDDATKWRQTLRENLEKNSYDVFIIGDVPASRFAPGTKEGGELLQLIKKKVDEGAGFLMIGGQDSFGDGGWGPTPIAPLVPVDLGITGQLEGPAGGQRDIQFVPTPEGLSNFALRLESNPERNKAWWERLPKLNGGNRLGSLKGGAVRLAKTEGGDILMAAEKFGKGRTVALAVDTTFLWAAPGPPHDPKDAGKPGVLSEGAEAHVRFWRQLILWLARQEDAGKALRIELAHRRLSSGKDQRVTVQAREVTPGGTRDESKPIKGAEFTVKVKKPGNLEELLPVHPDGGEEGKSNGLFLHTDEPGEYEVEVTGKYQGVDLGSAKARFMAYRDDSELLNRTANHALLEQIARATGGTSRLHGGLRDLLDELKPEAKTQVTQVLKLPNWDESNLPLQMTLFLIFVGLICLEWLLRRVWGLV